MTGPIGYDDLRHDTVIQVAKLMAGAAITAPKSGGQLFLAGKHNFIETVIVDDADTRHQLAEWMRARGQALGSNRCRTCCNRARLVSDTCVGVPVAGGQFKNTAGASRR